MFSSVVLALSLCPVLLSILVKHRVKRAIHYDSRRTYAVKILDRTSLQDPVAQEQVTLEVRSSAGDAYQNSSLMLLQCGGGHRLGCPLALY